MNQVLEGHTDEIFSCAFNYEGNIIITGNLKILVSIGLLQLTITFYKTHHAGGQAHYYFPTGTLKQRQVNIDWFRSLCFNFPVGE